LSRISCFHEGRTLKRRTAALLSGGFLALGLFGAASAGPLKDGWAAYHRGDYATAMSYWLPLAAQGDYVAQYALGSMYALGQGVPQDDALAYLWLNLAASRATDASIRDQAAKSRDRVAGRMTSEQIADAQRMARDWGPTR
jgi:TPR repeat protein